MRSRIARGRLQYFRRVKLEENRLLSRVMENAQKRDSEWMRETRTHMDWTGIQERELAVMTKEQVKSRIAEVVQEE